MKDLIITLAVLLVIFIPAAYAQQYDSQSLNSRYNQYSPDNLNRSYSQYEVQYSPKNITSPHSQYNVQYSPKNVSNFPVQQEHGYHGNIASGTTQGEGPKKAKPSAEEALMSSFFGNTKPKRNIPVFFYLLAASALAVGATIFIIIGLFKK